MLRADYQDDISVAQSNAARAMRKYDRELSGLKLSDLLGQVGCAIHIIEAIRLALGSMEAAEKIAC